MDSRSVVCYARVSTTQGQEVSLERQKELLLSYCASNNLAAPILIADELSGFKSSDERPGFKRLLDLCNAGTVGVVAVYDLSRLSRRVLDVIKFFDGPIRTHNIRFVSLQQNLDSSTPGGVMLINTLAVYNNFFRDEVVWKTKLAMAHKRTKGERLGGHLPWGYDLAEDGIRLVLNQREIDALFLMQRLRASGVSYRGIGKELTRRGIKTKTGLNRWHPKTIMDLLARSQAGGSGDKAVTVGDPPIQTE